jgi:outer membrane protein W
MTMGKKIIFLTVLLLVLFLVPLTGYSESGKLGLGVRGGLYKSTDADNYNVYGGIQARWRLFPAMSVEGALDYHPTDSYPDSRKITSYQLLASVLFHIIPGAKISPYLLLGLGWYYSQVEDSGGSNTVYTPGLHMGAGVDIPLTSDISFNTDIRYYFLNYDDQRVKDLKTDGYIISVGITFFLW